jgi:hypothetical protein
MIAGGINSIEITNIVEIIDLETTKSICSNFPALPRIGYTALGLFVDNDHPIVCGGFNYQNEFDK